MYERQCSWRRRVSLDSRLTPTLCRVRAYAHTATPSVSGPPSPSSNDNANRRLRCALLWRRRREYGHGPFGWTYPWGRSFRRIMQWRNDTRLGRHRSRRVRNFQTCFCVYPLSQMLCVTFGYSSAQHHCSSSFLAKPKLFESWHYTNGTAPSLEIRRFQRMHSSVAGGETSDMSSLTFAANSVRTLTAGS